MNTKLGLWIDHKDAFIVSKFSDDEEVKRISSKLEKPQQAPMDDMQQRVWTEHLNHYYDKVISALGKANTILILGPGEAKGELAKRIERTTVGKRNIEIETVDKMTEPQIIAKVRGHFLKQ